MKKCILIAMISFLACAPLDAAPARPKVKIDLMNSLVQLTLKCLDNKIENEIFKDALYEIYTLLHDSEYQSEDKDELLKKIKLILALLMGDGQDLVNQDLDAIG